MLTSIKKISEFTRYNSGKALYDSGDYYGRNYERPVSDDLITVDSSDCPATINLTRWLADNAQIATYYDNYFYTSFLDLHADNNKSWFDLVPEFMEEGLEDTGYGAYKQVARDNVYNSENDFDQVFIFEIWVPEYVDCIDWLYCDEAVVVIYVHTGCDVRGGYSKPLFCIFPDSEFTIPLDWQVSYYSNELSDNENDLLQVSYSGYPWGQLEDMNLEYVRSEKDSYIFKRDGEEIRIHPELYVG